MPLWKVEVWRGRSVERSVYLAAEHAPAATHAVLETIPAHDHYRDGVAVALRPRQVLWELENDQFDGTWTLHARLEGGPAEEVGSIQFGAPRNAAQRFYQLTCGWLVVSGPARRVGIATELFTRFLSLPMVKGKTIYAEYSREGAAFIRAYQQKHGPIAGLRGGWEK